ncbi:MAG: DoxX family protein [Bacteroidetes bacterium]|nr:MAG: DoxX family protein [Bacteroidota bacterium]
MNLINLLSISACVSPILILKVMISIFLAILFLQSGLDKLIDWKGNFEWLKGHFANSPFKNFVPFLLGTISIFETAAGACSAIGIFELIFTEGARFAMYGLLLAGLSILCLLFGQRMAKDYAGAAVLVGYFLVVLFGIYLYA